MAGQLKQGAGGIAAPECPVCMNIMTVPIFQCQSGHSLCNTCTRSLLPPICPICRQTMTQMRNWQLEELVSEAKVPCLNKVDGCQYTLKSLDMDDHLKECIFRVMQCPLGVVSGKCSWSGKLNTMIDHFKERHTSNCNVNTDADVTINNVTTNADDRHMFLVPQGKLLFILTFKVDTIHKLAHWTIQHIGTKNIAQQHIYEIHVTSKKDNRRKVVFTEHCFNDAIKVEDIVRLGKCAVLPLDVFGNFIKDKQMSFRFFIKRLPGPPKNKSNGDGPSNPPKGSKPGGPGKAAGKGPGKGPGGPPKGPRYNMVNKA